MREPYPSETQDRFMVRLPDGMRDEIKTAAQATKRTMNGEIIARLDASLQADKRSEVRSETGLGAIPEPNLEARVRSLEIAVMAILANVSDIADKLDNASGS